MDDEFLVDKSLLPLTPHLLLPHRADPSCLPSLLYAHGWRMLDRQPLTKLPKLSKFRTVSLIGTLAIFLPRSLALSSHPYLPHCGFYTSPLAMTSSLTCVGKLWGKLPATPLCPEVLSIAANLLFNSGQDQGTSGPLLGLQWTHSRALLPKPSPFPVRPLFCANFLQPLSAQRCSLSPRPYLPLKFCASQWHIWTIQGPPPGLSFAQCPCLCGISIRDSNTTGLK